MIGSFGATPSVTASIMSGGLARARSRWQAIAARLTGIGDRIARRRISSSEMQDDYRLHGLNLIPIDFHYQHLSRSFWRDV
jgi:hypothetical protein